MPSGWSTFFHRIFVSEEFKLRLGHFEFGGSFFNFYGKLNETNQFFSKQKFFISTRICTRNDSF